MQCVKNVAAHTPDQAPFECASTLPAPDRDDDLLEVPDDLDSDVPEEAGYGYGV
jgi:hypothetical protein